MIFKVILTVFTIFLLTYAAKTGGQDLVDIINSEDFTPYAGFVLIATSYTLSGLVLYAYWKSIWRKIEHGK